MMKGVWLSFRLIPMQMNPILGTQIAQKMAILGHFQRILKQRSATCESHSRPPPSSFSLKLCVIALHTHGYHAPKFQPNPKHHDGVPIFSPFCACCCLLATAAAKPRRSTLHTKKGYKTKTGSTSSVTLTLTWTAVLALIIRQKYIRGMLLTSTSCALSFLSCYPGRSKNCSTNGWVLHRKEQASSYTTGIQHNMSPQICHSPKRTCFTQGRV